jgi:hypothetical protein
VTLGWLLRSDSISTAEHNNETFFCAHESGMGRRKRSFKFVTSKSFKCNCFDNSMTAKQADAFKNLDPSSALAVIVP